MKRPSTKKIVTDIGIELIGSVMTGIGLYNFAVPANFPMTGFSGLALIFYRLLHLPIGWMTLALNVPVALLCWKKLGKGFFLRSIRCMVFSSLFVDYAAPLLPVYTGSRLIAAICSGVIGGIGYAMIYMRNSSTGGSDFIVMAVKASHPHIQLGTIVFCTDALIILAGGILFRDFDGIVYGMIINYIYAIVVDKIMYGMNAGKLAIIVTDFSREVTRRIDELTERGTTIIHAEGGYRGDPRDVVLCACSTKDMILVEKAVKQADEAAFTVVLESNEVLGYGFRSVRVAEPGK